MRLRSRKHSGDPEKDKFSGEIVVQKRGDEIEQEVFDLNSESLEHEKETLDLKTEVNDVVQVVKQECKWDGDVGMSRDVKLDENGKKKRRISRENDNEEPDIERTAKKKEDLINKGQISGRVLRSGLWRSDDKKPNHGEINGVSVGESRDCEGLNKKKVEEEIVEAEQSFSIGHEKDRVKVKKEDNNGQEFKRKRGRPPKLKMNLQGRIVGKPYLKRGRPPKVGRNHNPQKVAYNGKVGFRKGEISLCKREDVNSSASDDKCSVRESCGEELAEMGSSPVKKRRESGMEPEMEDKEVASPLRSYTVNVCVAEKNGKNKAKQVVREQIWKLLKDAGWTVEYRPRNGREYNDAVYVSLDAKTHWSITLAYNRLKMHYEAADGEGKVYGPGFRFTPIPEEDFRILTKVITKKREGKKKLKQMGEKGRTFGRVNKKVKKDLGSPGLGRSTKRKWSLLEKDSAAVALSKGMRSVAKDYKRQKTQSKKRCGLLVRNAKIEMDLNIDGYVPYSGKRTVLAWMIDVGTVLPNGKVYYMSQGRKCVRLEGRIAGDGIHCDCCNDIITISKFEAHAGSQLSDPLKNIYIEGQTSLLQCLLDSWHKQDETERKGFHFIDVEGEDPNDDTCGICGDGGDLFCCDGCPSTFHQSCLDIKKFPSGDWHCIYCCCKFCGLVDGSTNQRDSCDDSTASALLSCRLCEKKYHRSCIEVNGAMIDNSGDGFFCGSSCQELSKRLEILLGIKHEIADGFSCTFIRRSDVGPRASQIRSQIVECNSKLAVALSIMDECFMPYIDHRSGVNLVRSILYNCGSNFNRLNFSGFFTAILERDDEIIAAASIRIHGNQLAEMPFIGTRYMYRRQGMCSRLLSGIESALRSLNVELLVIPAISELRETWTSVFGFEPLELTSKQKIKNLNLLVFPHTDMLQKKILNCEHAYEKLIPAQDSNPQIQKHQTVLEVANNCDKAGSSGSDSNISRIPDLNASQINDEPISIDCGSLPPDGSFNDAPDVTSKTLHQDKCSRDVKCQEVPSAIYDNFLVESRSNANSHHYVNDDNHQAEKINTYQNAGPGCINLALDKKPVDLNIALNISCLPEETEREGCYIGASSDGIEDIHGKVGVVDGIVMKDDNGAEDSSSHLAESNGDCKSTKLASSYCEDITKDITEDTKPSNAAASYPLLADKNLPNKPWMNQSSEQAGTDSQADQTTWRSGPSLSPNTVSGVVLHCASAGANNSCGNNKTEVVLLSNQAS